jgi:hypothetical protein
MPVSEQEVPVLRTAGSHPDPRAKLEDVMKQLTFRL